MAIGDELIRAQVRRAARQAEQQAPAREPARIIQPSALAGAGNRQTGQYHDQTGEVWWSNLAWNSGTW